MTKHFPRHILFFAIISAVILGLLFPAAFFRASASEKNQKKPADDPWIMTSYADLSGKQGMFYTLYCPSKKRLVVVDGGWEENEKQVRKVIKKYGGVVHAWILTHYHDDHIEAFNKIYEKPDGIKIKDIYVSPMDYEAYLLVAKEWDDPEDFSRFLTLTEKADNIHRVKRGDTFSLAGLKIRFFNTYDNELLKHVGNNDLPNNGSLVFKATVSRDSVLFCADAHSTALADHLRKKYGKDLKSTYVQVGHHGNNSFPTSFYEAVDPKYAIFDAPYWLVLDSSYTTWKLEQWCIRRGIDVFDFRSAPNRFKLR